MEFNLEEQIATLTHPKFNEIKITLKKLDEVEKMEYFSELSRYTTPVVLKNPENGELLFKQDGNFAVYEQQRIPLTSVVDFLKKVIKKIDGITGKGGAPLNIDQQIRMLFNKKLNLTEEVDGKIVETPYWGHIQQKALEDSTFDTDPTANS